MEYSVRPTRSELERVKGKIEDCIESYSYALDVDNVEFFLSWQRHEGSLSVLEASDNEVMVAVNPESEEYGTEGVLRAVLELEFLEKAEYSKVKFKWQEAAKFAYTALRMKEIKDEELRLSEDIVARWPSVQEQLGEKVDNYEKFFYMNTGMIGEALATKLEDLYSIDEVPGLSKSDVMDAGEKFFE